MPPKECFETHKGLDTFTNFGIETIRRAGLEGLSRKQRRMLDMAARLAEASEMTQRHGAVLVKGGRVLSVGINKWRNREMVKYGTESAECLSVHAEIDALSRVKDARGAVLYVARVGFDGAERFSRPCDRCTEALMAAGVKQIVYTMD